MRGVLVRRPGRDVRIRPVRQGRRGRVLRDRAGGARDARTGLGVSSASYRTKLETDTSRAIQSPATHSNDNENGR